ncbi:MAG TPA: site-2 protease family protein [Candidatus Paceibacterota bacterium]|nr:site-2 protease family protein [Candidatus Paceibacterota bacterium]
MEFKLFLYVIIVLSAVFHEYAHALTAYRLGDTTAKNAGRLTLNPLVHLDPVGTVLVPLLLLFTSGIFIGWAKPVPYNPLNLRDKRYGSLKVGVAGPGANLLIALVLGIVLRLLPYFFSFSSAPLFAEALATIVYVNIFLGLFNLLPFPPLDGSKIFMDAFPSVFQRFLSLGFLGLFIALLVAFWVLPPIADFLFSLVVGQAFGF